MEQSIKTGQRVVDSIKSHETRGCNLVVTVDPDGKMFETFIDCDGNISFCHVKIRGFNRWVYIYGKVVHFQQRGPHDYNVARDRLNAQFGQSEDNATKVCCDLAIQIINIWNDSNPVVCVGK